MIRFSLRAHPYIFQWTSKPTTSRRRRACIVIICMPFFSRCCFKWGLLVCFPLCRLWCCAGACIGFTPVTNNLLAGYWFTADYIIFLWGVACCLKRELPKSCWILWCYCNTVSRNFDGGIRFFSVAMGEGWFPKVSFGLWTQGSPSG